MVESLHAKWWNVPSGDGTHFVFVGEVVSKYIQREKATLRGVAFHNMDKLSIRHMKHIFFILSQLMFLELFAIEDLNLD
jgi:hypothetical protein